MKFIIEFKDTIPYICPEFSSVVGESIWTYFCLNDSGVTALYYADELESALDKVKRNKNIDLRKTLEDSEEYDKSWILNAAHEAAVESNVYDYIKAAFEDMRFFKHFVDIDGKDCEFYESTGARFNVTIVKCLKYSFDKNPGRDDWEHQGQTKGEYCLDMYLEEEVDEYKIDSGNLFNNSEPCYRKVEENIHTLLIDYTLGEYTNKKTNYFNKLKALIRAHVPISSRPAILKNIVYI